MNHSLEYMYDNYSPVMYGIAMQISSSEKKAKEILTGAFKKIHKQPRADLSGPLLCLGFIKLTIETACEQFPEYIRDDLQLEPFHRSIILKKLLCENASIKSISDLHNMTTSQFMKYIKMEMDYFLNSREKYLIRSITIAA